LDGAVGIAAEMSDVVWDLEGCVLGREVLFGFSLSAKGIERFDG